MKKASFIECRAISSLTVHLQAMVEERSFSSHLKARSCVREFKLTRTIWIAAFCLACVGGLFAIKITSPRPNLTEQKSTVDRGIITSSLVQDTLTKDDKLVSYDKRSVEGVPSSKPLVNALQTAAIAKASKISQGLSNTRETRTAVRLPKSRPKTKVAKNEQAKPAIDTKNCPQPDSLFGILASATGSRRCG